MNDIKIILLCNNKIAIPAIQELLFYRHVAAIIVPSANKEVIEILKEISEGSSVELITVDKKNFEQKIKEVAEASSPVAAVMMTFPYIIPKKIIALLPKGFINFHYGKLPEYRGPEPIFAQVVNQEKSPGLTIHVVTDGIDTGPVILQETVVYDEDDTYGMLQHKLADAGARVINLLMKILSFGTIVPALPQDESEAGYYKKPTAADLMIDWQMMNGLAIKALVNACNPWNKGCGASLDNHVFGITEIEEANDSSKKEIEPGTILACSKQDGLIVKTIDDKAVKINIVYTNEGFLSGHRLAEFGIKAGMKFK